MIVTRLGLSCTFIQHSLFVMHSPTQLTATQLDSRPYSMYHCTVFTFSRQFCFGKHFVFRKHVLFKLLCKCYMVGKGFWKFCEIWGLDGITIRRSILLKFLRPISVFEFRHLHLYRAQCNYYDQFTGQLVFWCP